MEWSGVEWSESTERDPPLLSRLTGNPLPHAPPTLCRLEKFPAHVVPVQRCVAVLLGVAQSIGAGSVSIAQMWEKPAREFLKKRREERGEA